MAFGYEYLMVYLPEVCPASFLLFVHNPGGATKLRDYSNGQERQLKQKLGVADVLARTTVGTTRFYQSPHPTDGHGVGYWTQVTRDLNHRYLPNTVGNPPVQQGVARQPTSTRGRAVRGSRRQLQDYVNEFPEALTEAILAALPSRLRELSATVRWVSPVAKRSYEEYRDGEFLSAVGLQDATNKLEAFWPAKGPCWDALGVISDPFGRLKPGVVLLEAKSHIPEVYGNGCQAGGDSLAKIEQALTETKLWLDVDSETNWLGPLYQYGNRLAYLYFLLKRVGTPAWLVNLYFLDDPIGPTTEQAWRAEIQKVKRSLGITNPVANAVDVFLSAVATSGDLERGQRDDQVQETFMPRQRIIPTLPDVCPNASPTALSFQAWSRTWIELASFPGPVLVNPAERIDRLMSLWKEPIPGAWQRSVADTPTRLLHDRRYTRGDEACPRNGEHRIEHEVLCQYFQEVTCLGDFKLIDGVNAFPLVRDDGGGRNGNVEADMLLLVQGAQGYRIVVAEVKESSGNAWYAAVENLRQIKLLNSGDDPCQLFRQRRPTLRLPKQLPTTGIVLAPPSFYRNARQKANCVSVARMLINRTMGQDGAPLQLCIWDKERRAIVPVN